MNQTVQTISVMAADLPLHCPTSATPAWNSHPRVFLDVARLGQVACPYCGTVYKFEGELPHGH